MALAVVFPGQGSQSLGMLGALARSCEEVAATFAEASLVLGYDLWKLVQEGPEEELNATEKTQPAMLAAGVAVWRAWRARGGKEPLVMAGHSLGEYTALVCAGALGYREAVALVAERGRLMQQAVPEGEGAMAAIIGLEPRVLEEICRRSRGTETLSCANFNSPEQTVIAGHRRAVERAILEARAGGARRAVLLPVSVPSHCPLMKPAAARLAQRLKGCAIRPPAVAVLHNVDAGARIEAAGIVEALSSQLSSPVRWVETVEGFARRGVKTVLECGPGRVLTGLCKRIDSRLTCLPVFDPPTLEAALAATGGT